jgi:RNA polymerase sigma-70 factor (ECF subfamily)
MAPVPQVRRSAHAGCAKDEVANVPLSDYDHRLLDRCLAHEPGAWREFVDRYMGLIYHVVHHVGYARSVNIRPEDVEDIAAQIFLAIVKDDYRVLRQYRRTAALPTYLSVIARRVCIKELVVRKREAELGHVTASRAALADAEETSDEIEPIATADEVERMLKDLPDREAQVIRLYHLQFLNYRQIAKQVGVPENSVGPILAKGRKGLRKLAEQRQQ